MPKGERTQFEAGAALVFGASGGIGGAIARGLAQAGTAVAATYRTNRAGADALTAEIRANGGDAASFVVDVTDRAATDAVVAEAVTRFGRIHTIAFVAGAMPVQKHVANFTEAEWRTAIDTEVHGFFNVVQASLPHLRAAGGGAIVHLGSAGDRLWPARDGLSVVPKAANEALVRGIAREEGRHGIRANSVLIGVVEAGMFLKFEAQGVFDPQWSDAVRASLPLRRFGQAHEVADAVVFLASSRASYVTGQQIAVAGGYGV
jgi:NAD(P)-dependent dehydrogenase (short-subunit alcohol dehydrogenase family)